jgi:beta-glucosidase
MSRLRFLRVAASSLLRQPDEMSRTSTTASEGVLPSGFLLGAATSAHQVEGGNENDWTEWELSAYPDGRPHIHDGSVSGAACDSWNLFEEDLRCLRELGANAYRFGVEWSRLEPEEGAWNTAAAERYGTWLSSLRAAGIQSMVTLMHFTLPSWVARDGGWLNEKTVDRFGRFVERVAAALGDRVDLWCTVNEPNVAAAFGYVTGEWPPGRTHPAEGMRAILGQLQGHARASRILRERTGRPVGLAHHVRIFEPARARRVDRILTALTDDSFNQSIVDALLTGRVQLYLPGQVSIDEHVPGLAGSADYLGLNYYSRDRLQADLREPALSRRFAPPGRPTNDLGWDIYPDGLEWVLLRWGNSGLPLYVTENGIADAEGTRRADFLREHIRALRRALAQGIDVRGYFHWSLLDNFEWAEGYRGRFGLYRVDFQRPDKPRTPTSGVPAFQQIARELGLQPTSPLPR